MLARWGGEKMAASEGSVTVSFSFAAGTVISSLVPTVLQRSVTSAVKTPALIPKGFWECPHHSCLAGAALERVRAPLKGPHVKSSPGT